MAGPDPNGDTPTGASKRRVRLPDHIVSEQLESEGSHQGAPTEAYGSPPSKAQEYRQTTNPTSAVRQPHRQTPVQLDAILYGETLVITGKVTHMSLTGLHVACQKSFEVDEMVGLDLECPAGILQCLVRIYSVTPQDAPGKPKGMSVRFVKLKPIEIALVMHTLDALHY